MDLLELNKQIEEQTTQVRAASVALHNMTVTPTEGCTPSQEQTLRENLMTLQHATHTMYRKSLQLRAVLLRREWVRTTLRVM